MKAGLSFIWAPALSWKRFLVIWAVVFSMLVAAEANSQALLRPLASGRVNNAVAKVIQNRAKRMGFAANDNVVNATMAGVGAAATELAVAAGVAVAVGTPIGWGGILLTGLAVGAITYFAAGSDDPMAPVRKTGDGTYLASAPEELFPKLIPYQATNPTQKSQGILQFTGGPIFKVDPRAGKPLHSVVITKADANVASLNATPNGYFYAGCASGSPYGAAVCGMHVANWKIDEIGVPGSAYWTFDYQDTYTCSCGANGNPRINFRRAAFQDPTTGIVYQEQVTSAVYSGEDMFYTTARGALEVNNDGRNSIEEYEVAWNQGAGWQKIVPQHGYKPKQSNAWYYVNGLPQSTQAADLEPGRIADLANQLWRDAAAQPGYTGLPYSVNDPITRTDADAVRKAEPAAWPQVADMADPIATAGTNPDSITFPDNVNLPANDPATMPDPATQPAPNPNPVTDLGGDPGVGAPDLGEAPSWADIVDPLFTWFPAIGALEIPGGTCPTDSFQLWDQTFTLDQHCPLLEDWRNVIGAAMLAVWTMAACVVLLRA